MKIIYRIKRMIRGLIRSLFNDEVPGWLVELYGLLEYVNFINLTPTLAAILTVPDHFFARVYLLVNRRKAGIKEELFKSPIKLVTTVATLIWATKWLVPYVAVPRQKEILVVLFVGLPVWIPVLCVTFRVLAELGYIFIFRGLQSIIWGLLPASKGIAFLSFEQGLRYLMVPLSPHTYAALDLRRMFWNALYFFGYVISIPLLSLTMFFLGVRLLFRMTIHGLPILDYFSSLHVPSTLSVPVAMDIVAVLTIAFGRLVIYPYSVAMLYSLRRPTRLSRRIQMHQYFRAAETLAHRVTPLVQALGSVRGPEQMVHARTAIRNHIIMFRLVWHRFDHQLLRWNVRFQLAGAASEAERSVLLSSYEGLDVLHGQLVDGPLNEDQIDFVVRWVDLSTRLK